MRAVTATNQDVALGRFPGAAPAGPPRPAEPYGGRRHTNGSQFFVTTVATPHLDGARPPARRLARIRTVGARVRVCARACARVRLCVRARPAACSRRVRECMRTRVCVCVFVRSSAGKHVVFGKVVKGMATVRAIEVLTGYST